jgi:hypothetical protein
MSLTKVSYSMIAGAPVNIVDFGAVSGGNAATNATAINAAIQSLAATGGVIEIPPGTYEFSAKILINRTGVVLRGQGNESPSTGTTGAVVLKRSDSLTGDAISIEAGSCGIEGITLDKTSTVGAGNGIKILSFGACLRNVCVRNMGTDGINIGDQTAGGDNANSWTMYNCVTTGNAGYGLYISSTTRDANAGTAVNFRSYTNGADGIRLEKCSHNTFIGTLCEQNVGYGIRFTLGAQNNYFFGGDVDEANGAFNLGFDNGATDNMVFAVSGSADFVDAGQRNFIEMPADGLNPGISQSFVGHRLDNKGDVTNPFKFAYELQNSDVVNSNTGTGILFTVDSVNGSGRQGIAVERTGSGGVGKIHILMRSTSGGASLSLADSVCFWDQNGKLTFNGATTAKAPINLIAGTNPTSPVDGDFWYDGSNLKFRLGGTTKTLTWT